MTYNYARFKNSYYDFTAFEGPGRGDQMPDLVLSDLDGNPVRLSDLWDRRVVIETGSTTCPMYAKGVGTMADMAERYPDIRFVVIYVREAHPGERIGPHETLERKLELAAGLGSAHDEGRMTLVDDVDGTAHRTLGSLPDMVYVLVPGGRVIFRADWNDLDTLEQVLEGDVSTDELTREHFPPAKPGPRTALTTLLSGGFAALFDFIVSLPGLLSSHRKADQAFRDRTETET